MTATREFKFVTGFETESPPVSSDIPQNDSDLVPNRVVNGYRLVDLGSLYDSVAGQLLGDRPFLIINANTGGVAFKGLAFTGIAEVTVINSLGVDISVAPAPSLPGHGFTEPPTVIPKNKSYKFIRNRNTNRWFSIGGSGSGGRAIINHADVNNNATLTGLTTPSDYSIYVKGNGGPVNLNFATSPIDASNLVAGNRVTIICTDATNTIELIASAYYLGPGLTLGYYQNATLEWTGAFWFLVNNN